MGSKGGEAVEGVDDKEGPGCRKEAREHHHQRFKEAMPGHGQGQRRGSAWITTWAEALPIGQQRSQDPQITPQPGGLGIFRRVVAKGVLQRGMKQRTQRGASFRRE